MPSSFCWKFFDVDQKDQSKAVCKLCEASISRGGKSSKTFTTTNMLNHLKKIHPEEAKVELKLKRSYNESLGDSTPGLTSSTSTYETQKKFQTTIKSIMEKKKRWDINDHRSQEIHYLIVRYVKAI